MVKYMNKKPNVEDDVTELSHSSMGVLTRAKTLALQHQLQLLSNSPNLDTSSSASYLQLRTRRLVKPTTPFHPIRLTRNPNFATDSAANSESQGFFGENNMEFQCRERSTRESTPCSFIRGCDTIGTPGSTTLPASSSATYHRVQGVELPYFPTIEEIEEFFAFAEQHQQMLFSEKYNFDFVNDIPLRGLYDWVSVYP